MLVAAAVAGLEACGGGGGQAGGQSNTGSPTVPVSRPASLALLAGNMGGPGQLDGAAGAAYFNFISAPAMDRAGNVYVVGYWGQKARLRKVSPAGDVTTVDLSATGYCSKGIVGVVSPSAMAADSSGNLFVVPHGCDAVMKITPSGVVSVFAGSVDEAGQADGLPATARFQYPDLIAADAQDNLFVNDWRGIRKITPAGVVSTYFVSRTGAPSGIDGPQGVATLYGIRGLAADAAGNLFVTTSASTIRRIAPDQTVNTLAGASEQTGTADGVGAAARFTNPKGIAVGKSGTLYVADEGNHTLRVISPSGQVTTLAGRAGVSGAADGRGADAGFREPQAVMVSAEGRIVVTESLGTRLRAVLATGDVTTLAGSHEQRGKVDAGGTQARFERADSITVDREGNAFVVDYPGYGVGASNVSTLRKLTPAGVVSTLSTMPPVRFPGEIYAIPRGDVAVDASGQLFVSDVLNRTILKRMSSGELGVMAGKEGEAALVDGNALAARFVAPAAMAMDSAGNLYVADATTIRRVSASGAVSTLAGSLTRTSTIDGRGAEAAFSNISGVAVDSKGAYLYVAEASSHVIRRLELSSGLVSTLAGTAGLAGSANGTGFDARFNWPSGLCVDDSGNVYVADTNNDLIRKITPTGSVTTVAGAPGKGGFQSGSLPGVLRAPTGLAIQGRKLFIAMGTGVAVIDEVP
jgi:sugar lactone lactonase YvrE